MILLYTHYWQEMLNLLIKVQYKPPEVLGFPWRIPGCAERMPSACSARNAMGDIKPVLALLKAMWVTRE